MIKTKLSLFTYFSAIQKMCVYLVNFVRQDVCLENKRAAAF